MPELPEVEIARENLERWLLGRRIGRARVADRRMRGGQSRRRLETALEGASVRAVARRGKFLLFDLGPKRDPIIAHLGMTGKFVRISPAEDLPRFTRASLELGRGERVVYCDARRLGQFRLLDAVEKERISALGLEPLAPDFSPKTLSALTMRSKQAIKLFLMDQRKVAGIGNIQAAEALFRARIHPRRAARSLDGPEIGRLVRAIRKTLQEEIARSRGDDLTYLHEGSQNDFRVYGRKGEPCSRCRTLIVRFVQAARSSYYCPRCQREA